MADITTYEGLKAAILDYLGRDDIESRIPTIIALAERRLNRDLRMRCMEARSVSRVEAGVTQVPLPNKRVAGDWDVFLSMRDLIWMPLSESTGINLWYSTPDEYAVETQLSGRPSHFTIVGNDLFILPATNEDGTLYLSYYAEIPPLGTAQTTNEVLQSAPDVYLYACLAESVPWTRGSTPGADWQKYYQEARTRVMQTEQDARYPVNIAMKPIRRV